MVKRLFSIFVTVVVIFMITVCSNVKGEGMSVKAGIDKNGSNASEISTAMQISVTANGKTTVFELNDSPAARDLYAQLPLTLPVEDYNSNEKIFYPPEKLDITDTPRADARAGTLAYYAPWGDVVMFYEKFGSAAGLYDLGLAVSGSDHIRALSGEIRVEKSSTP